MKQIRASDIALLLLRVVTGVIIAYFGSQKVLGVFGGMGYQGTITAFKEHMGMPMPLAISAMAGEFLGGLGLVFGVLTRFAAFGVASVMAVATYVSASKPGVLSEVLAGNPPTAMSGVAFPLMIGIVALAILIMGGGSIALDSKLFGKKRPKVK